VPRLLPLLEDDDLELRAAAIHLLGHLESAAATIVPALDSALEREADPYLRASVVLAMARCNRRAPEGMERTERAAARIANESALGEAVATLAAFYLHGTSSEPERARLRALDERALAVHPSFAWNRGRIGAHARLVHQATMPVDEVLAALERGERDRFERAQALLFPVAAWRGDDLLLPEELSADQLRLLRWCASVEQAFYQPFWRDSGLPTTALWLSRFVGAEPPGPLERRVPVESADWPLWKVLHAVASGRLPEAEWSRIAKSFDDDALLAIYDEATGRGYQLQNIRAHIAWSDRASVARGKAYRDRFYRLLLDVLIDRRSLVERLHERADRLLAETPGHDTYLERTLVFAALGLAAAGNGTELDARYRRLAEPRDWSPAMTLVGVLRWGLASLPISERWPWFEGLRLISLTRVEDTRGVRHRVRIHDGWELVDLIPTAAARDFVRDALRALCQHRSGTIDASEHELGLTKGPLVGWAEDDPLPSEAFARIARSWGALWKELVGSLEGELTPELRAELEGSLGQTSKRN
jgi:hypothetical protein